MNASERRRWLESLAEACERILERGVGDSRYAFDVGLRQPLEQLLAELRAELAKDAGGPSGGTASAAARRVMRPDDGAAIVYAAPLR